MEIKEDEIIKTLCVVFDSAWENAWGVDETKRIALDRVKKLFNPLKPCPFCGSERCELSRCEDGFSRVDCWCCGASSAQFKTRDLEQDAISAWNRRVK